MIQTPTSLLSFLSVLRAARFHYQLSQCRDDAIMVQITVPGERWEVEFMEDGSVEAEVFRSDGEIRDVSVLAELIARHGDASPQG